MNNLLLTAVTIGSVEDGFCASTANIWQIAGYVLLIFKIIIPILLILLGALDLGKAVIGSKDDDVKKAVNALIRRFVAAVVIFFLPTIIGFLMNVIGGWNKDEAAKNDYSICRTCITKPGSGSTCAEYANKLWNGEE